jgi:hypothetical protein
MKLSTLIIAAIFTLQVSNIFAGNTRTKNLSVLDLPGSPVLMLAPTTPAEADFSDVIIGSDFNLLALAPVTPSVADFNDISPEIKSSIIDLVPETPSFADFDEETNDQPAIVSLVPVTPAEADFE